jgi:hypothetical protein
VIGDARAPKGLAIVGHAVDHEAVQAIAGERISRYVALQHEQRLA